MKFARIVYNNSLTATLLALFFIFLIGLSFAGHAEFNEHLKEHSAAEQSYWSYVLSGEFGEAVFENWESEFLQMGMLVVLTIFLRQKGSADSKKLKGEQDFSSRHSIIHASTWQKGAKAVGKALHANSLGIALFALFILSFGLHALNGTQAFNAEAAMHSQPQVSIWAYITTSQFWFESFQNWQSEFLAVGVLLILSIYLRQRGSPESKGIGEPNEKTGE